MNKFTSDELNQFFLQNLDYAEDTCSDLTHLIMHYVNNGYFYDNADIASALHEIYNTYMPYDINIIDYNFIDNLGYFIFGK